MEDQDVVLTWMCLDYLMSRMRFVGHARDLDITIIAFFLGANSVERIAINVYTGQGEIRHIKDLLPESSTVNTDSLGRW